MKEKLICFLTSSKAAIILLAAYAFLMGIATLLEKEYSTATAKSLIYYSPAFMLLQLLLVLNFIGVSLKRKYFSWNQWGYAVLHGAFIVILTGAMVTHLTGKEALMHLREGEKNNHILVRQGNSQSLEQLPFEVELTDFTLSRYPGSHSPSSYESRLRLYHPDGVFDYTVYMNHVLDLDGYRFFQASYDSDEKGSILSVSYDVAGRTVTYTGYVLLIIGFIGCLLSPRSRFRRLCRQLGQLRTLLLVGGLGSTLWLQAQPVSIPDSHIKLWEELPMQDYRGRIVPVQTFASELFRKLQLSAYFEKEDDCQILLQLMTDPAYWAKQPLIQVEQETVRQTYTHHQERIAYLDAFTPQGDYKWETQVEEIYRKEPALRSQTERELLKLDEKINLLHQLFNYRLLRIFPLPQDTLHHQWIAAGDDKTGLDSVQARHILNLFNHYRAEYRKASLSGNWKPADQALRQIKAYQDENLNGLVLHPDRLRAEVSYNQLNLLPKVQTGYLIIGALLLLLSIGSWIQEQRKRSLRSLQLILTFCTVLLLALHTYSLAIRGYISGHAPWSNSYETMVFLSWSTVLSGLCFSRRSETAFALSTLFGGIVLFVSGLNWMDPEITPLVPVLKSPWLMFHVATIMMSYGFLGGSCMMGTTNLIALALLKPRYAAQLNRQIQKLSILNELSLYIGLVLLLIGIFLGAVWANESWGRYWSWDPKETWALITAIIYTAILHIRWFERKSSLIRFNWLSQMTFLAVLMTYFGVNYLLSGMHSYGNSQILAYIPFYVYLLFIAFFLLPGIAACVNLRFRKNVN